MSHMHRRASHNSNSLLQTLPRKTGESETAYENRIERTFNEKITETQKKLTNKSEKRKAYVQYAGYGIG